MNIHFDWYNVFYYVCEYESVTKAANFLCVSQPAVTKIIRNLETTLSMKLIIKTTTGIELTEDGKRLYEAIKKPIEELNEITHKFPEKQEAYTIRINAGHSTTDKFLMKAFHRFEKKHKDIKFSIHTEEKDISYTQLIEGKTDLIFFSMNNDYAPLLENKNIKIVPWKESHEVFAIGKAVKDDYPKKISIKDMVKYPIICKMHKSSLRKKVEELFEKNGVKFQPTYELSNNWLVEEYIKKGLGIGLVVDNLVKSELEDGTFIEIETDQKAEGRMFGYAYRKDTSKVEIIKEFMEEVDKN